MDVSLPYIKKSSFTSFKPVPELIKCQVSQSFTAWKFGELMDKAIIIRQSECLAAKRLATIVR